MCIFLSKKSISQASAPLQFREYSVCDLGNCSMDNMLSYYWNSKINIH